MIGKYKAVVSSQLTTHQSERYIVIDTETGEIVDDAQGYGFKSPKRAYACFGYKQNRLLKQTNRKKAFYHD